MADKTLNHSLLARPERIVLQRLVRLLPRAAKPADLTLIAVVGGLIAGVSFVLCNVSPKFLPLALAGIAISWFGDSADSLLARVRRLHQRPQGFLFEHSCDLLAQTAMVVGLGLSPYLTLTSALMLLSLYLLLSSYTYLRITVEGVHRLSYAGLGSTEFRAMLALWPTLAQLGDWRVLHARVLGLTGVDWAVAALSLCAFVAFILVVRQDLQRIDADEKRVRAAYSDAPAAPAPEEASPKGLEAHYPRRAQA
ncbi:hypothetical protein [Methylocystis heyeri]|uniref:CDP-alcohol phosphatidyltransferase family protein n=1 Tax=Methylocystis heyeri TaxID=391905 RepID=A0A6B8KBU3_9HYPH|nr:hypothetical protein [Methylocystis heyeri]QGM45179.1 hypothetical protein H2LOC_005440 [Methylocystis heyeri]